MNNKPLSLLAILLLMGPLPGQTIAAPTVPVYALEAAPTVDGDSADWQGMPATTLALSKTRPDSVVMADRVSVRAGTHDDRVYLLIEWEDATEDTLHKPWVWDAATSKYVKGPQREDRLAVQFSNHPDYSTNWLSGAEFTADTWHWKASRSNPLGLAHDKSLNISRSKLLRAVRLEADDGNIVYIARPSDRGDKLYRTKRYRRYDQELMPKYLLNESPAGSVADVEAQGVWSDGRWRLELSRKLVTGHDDDVPLPMAPGIVLGGIALFDRSENDDHAISETLTFDFLRTGWHGD